MDIAFFGCPCHYQQQQTPPAPMPPAQGVNNAGFGNVLGGVIQAPQPPPPPPPQQNNNSGGRIGGIIGGILSGGLF